MRDQAEFIADNEKLEAEAARLRAELKAAGRTAPECPKWMAGDVIHENDCREAYLTALRGIVASTRRVGERATLSPASNAANAGRIEAQRATASRALQAKIADFKAALEDKRLGPIARECIGAKITRLEKRLADLAGHN